MRLAEPFLRLPLQFDASRLAADVAALPESAWVPHPNRLPGNDAVRLVTTRGEQNDDIAAPMAPTTWLRACPTVEEVLSTIGAVWGRSRLMRLAPQAPVPTHVDTNYYWRTHVRLHVPIATTPDVQFSCADQTVHMAAGECWMFDTFRPHRVRNGALPRIHLVIDTAGGERLWHLMELARSTPGSQILHPAPLPIAFEQVDLQTLMSPWELRYHVAFIREQAVSHAALDPVLKRLDRFVEAWNAVWLQSGPAVEGMSRYGELLKAFERDLPTLGGQTIRLRNDILLYRQIAELLHTLSLPLAAGPAPGVSRAA